ncbi:serine/threonine protein kinase [Streptomyces cellostaticus]|uniref:Serine/threonine protein kinase n=1 Tax=Streptomyces cellostaticus TaxID=67285 RepID=A0A117PXB2_9ACTN|nr:serine/threonine-protein kinase [Streptomyces cellostaticus]KUM96993.1 serine/threonine protein kinase [Streptomyces cellostaticus]GHI05739.1 serine/threonine protein kinase [Streptomyces cellostaticus]
MQPLGADEPAAVGPYRLLGRLGSGGMGRVYLGRSAGGRTVAVKIVHPHFALDEEFRARFRREVEAARRVGGAWTAPVLDADPEAAVPWVATAYAAGPSLTAAVGDGGPLPPHTVRALGAGLAEALAAVHELGLVHRDVKPSNILLTLDGPLLIDFGIARATDGTASLTSTGVSVGSPGYMSPEQILGKGVTGAADVFSLGAVLAYAATGEPPFPSDSSAALLYKVVHEEPELGHLTGELRQAAAACLAKDPAARPAPAELARRLAPEGAARLVAGGWLPGALVEQVSRGAVHLLNLETTETAPSGLVEFSSPAVGGDAREAAAVAGESGAVSGEFGAVPGEFGPAPVMTPPGGLGFPAGVSPAVPSGTPAVPSGTPAVPSGTPAVPSGTPAVPSGTPAVPSGTPAVPSGAPAVEAAVVPGPRDAAPAPGKVSVSVAATSAPGENGRGRRVSCTVALAVAGALAGGVVGLGALLRPWAGGADDTAGSAPSASHTAEATPPGDAYSQEPGNPAAGDTPAPSASGGTAAAIPARYLGTWEGQATGLGGSLPMGTFRLTVHQAGVGEELGRLTQTDQLGATCTDILTLKKVTKTRIVATSTGAKNNHPGCDPTPHPVELTPTGDDLAYTSDSSAEGNPVSRMSKVD